MPAQNQDLLKSSARNAPEPRAVLRGTTDIHRQDQKSGPRCLQAIRKWSEQTLSLNPNRSGSTSARKPVRRTTPVYPQELR
jgi:hypothetical protein